MSALIPSARKSITVGERVFLDLDNLKILHGFTASNTQTSFRINNSATDYQAPAATFVVRALSATNADAASHSIGIGYNDIAIGQDAATSPTNPIYMGSGNTTFFPIIRFSALAGDLVELPSDFSVPNAKYPFYTRGSANGNSVELYGYESTTP